MDSTVQAFIASRLDYCNSVLYGICSNQVSIKIFAVQKKNKWLKKHVNKITC